MKRRIVAILVGVLLVTGAAAAPAVGEPVVAVPGGTQELPAEPQAPETAPAPSPEAVRAHRALEAAQPNGASEAGRTLTVTPDTGLVHGQVVTIHGTGWRPHHELVVIECGPGPFDPDGCEDLSIEEDDVFRPGAGGNFTTTHPVDVFVDGSGALIDCRLVTCRLAVLDLFSVDLSFADLGFDPGGPDPVRPPVTVTPNAGVVDGDVLTVSGSGFPPESQIDVGLVRTTFCRTPVTSPADCDRHRFEYVDVADDGTVDFTVVASAVLDLSGGPYDCRTGTCAVIVLPDVFAFTGLGELSEAGLADVAFDPGGALRPPPTLTVDPDSGLADGDVVELHATGFDPDRIVTISQCAAGASSSRDCIDGLLSFTVADATGDVHVFSGVVAAFVDGRGRTVDCRVDACSLIAATGDFGRYAEAPLVFDPDAPLLVPALTATPSADLHSGDEVVVTGTNWPFGQPVLVSQCPQDTADVFGCDVDGLGVAFPGLEGEAVPAARTREAAEAGTGFQLTFTVHAVIHAEDGPIDCRDAGCEILASDGVGLRSARVPITFAVGPISATPTFTG